MSNVNGTGTVFNLPNYAGDLFTADAVNTPFLSMIGGLNNGGLITANFEFPTSSLYSFPAAAQPTITETGSLTAPTAVSYVRDQSTNVTQIFQEKVSISYEKMSNAGRLSGLNTKGQENNAPSERDFQIAAALQKIARDANYCCINGVYQKATASDVANKTRGLIALCADANNVDAQGVALSKDLLQELFLKMYDNGAIFSNMILFTGGLQKQAISSLFGYAPMDRNVGGLNIKQIETDFGNIGIVLDRFVPAGTILLAEMSVIAPVFQPVPGKGNFFYEELAKTGAAEEGQIYGKFGLDHGPAFMHGTLINLKID